MVQFYEELVHGKASGVKCGQLADKSLNKKTKFTYSDSSSSDNDDDDAGNDNDSETDDQKDKEDEKDKPESHEDGDANLESSINADSNPHKLEENKDVSKENATCDENQTVEGDVLPAKRQCVELTASGCGDVTSDKKEEMSVDRLIEAELEELGDRNKVSE